MPIFFCLLPEDIHVHFVLQLKIVDSSTLTAHSGKKSLIIINDDRDLNKHGATLNQMAFSGRHSNLTSRFLVKYKYQYLSIFETMLIGY